MKELKAKRTKVLPYEHLFLERLPASSYYEKSYMHRDTVSHVVTSRDGYLITASIDGYLKFWRRIATDIGSGPVLSSTGIIEHLKTFRAHIGPITDLAINPNGTLLASLSVDQTLKIFDIKSLDLLLIKKLEFVPEVAVWTTLEDIDLIIADKESGNLWFLAKTEPDSKLELLKTFDSSIRKLAYSLKHRLVVSVSAIGTIVLFNPSDPNAYINATSEEDHLNDLSKVTPSPLSLTISPDEEFFCIFGSDRNIRVFRTSNGKLYRQYDESLSIYKQMFMDGKIAMEEDEFNNRIGLEKELANTPYHSLSNCIYDESGNFLLFATPIGIKVLNLVTHKVNRIIGRNEQDCRFVNLSLFQGTSYNAGLTLEMVASENPTLNNDSNISMFLVATAFRKHRVFIFTKQPINDSKDGRDVINERLTVEDSTRKVSKPKILPTSAILRTTVGDIHISLFPDKAPLAVENFASHARSGYYDNVLFHRIIRGFMVQTGDPLGDGTGGTSIWGREFKDEFHPELRHSQPFMVSMANAGRNTNGSQFFITVAKTPWLDEKHTIFGRVSKGCDVVSAIEAAETDELDKPKKDIKILQIDIVK